MRATPQDPTAQRKNRRDTALKAVSRLETAEAVVIRLFKNIPTVVVNFTNYNMTPFDEVSLRRDLRHTIYSALQVNDEDQNAVVMWWLSRDLEQAFRQGGIDQVVEINRDIAAEVVAGGLLVSQITFEHFATSLNYRNDLQRAYLDGFNSMRNLADNLAAQVYTVISSGVASGLLQSEITTQIVERFNIAMRRAKMIIDTEINKAYNGARMTAIQFMNDVSGLNFKVKHISALLPTTRPHHAARHNKVYTVQQQREWWGKNHNLISCHCSVRSVFGENAQQVQAQ